MKIIAVQVDLIQIPRVHKITKDLQDLHVKVLPAKEIPAVTMIVMEIISGLEKRRTPAEIQAIVDKAVPKKAKVELDDGVVVLLKIIASKDNALQEIMINLVPIPMTLRILSDNKVVVTENLPAEVSQAWTVMIIKVHLAREETLAVDVPKKAKAEQEDGVVRQVSKINSMKIAVDNIIRDSLPEVLPVHRVKTMEAEKIMGLLVEEALQVIANTKEYILSKRLEIMMSPAFFVCFEKNK